MIRRQNMANEKPKICLGLLTNRGFKAQTTISLLKMVNETPEFEWFILFSINGYTIAENRNWLAAQSVKNGCDFLLMIDDDMSFPPSTAKMLLGRDKDIIGVPYHMRVFPKQIYLLREEDAPPLSKTEPNEVLALGTGICLIRTDVFRKVPQPWFDFDKHENGMTKMGEDYWFCQKAYANGYKIWIEPEESFKDKEGKDLLGHIGDFCY